MVAIIKGQSAGGVGRALSPRPAGAWACLRVLQPRVLTSVFPGDAVPSFRALASRMALDDIAAMDAVEGRARFERTPLARFGT